MEAKIEKLKSYLKDPQRAKEENNSLLLVLQDILHVRENTPTEVKHDRDIYDLFHATMSLFMQPIGGYRAWMGNPSFKAEVDGNGNYIDPEDRDRESRFLRENRDNDEVANVSTEHRYSKWDIISPPFKSSSEDEKIARYQGFYGDIKTSYESWNDFQSHLRIDKAMIEHQRRRGIRRTTLQKIVDSYIIIAFPYDDKAEYESYIGELQRVELSNKQQNSDSQSSHELFDEYLLYRIHELCNGVQFECLSSDDFKNAINSPADYGGKLAIRKNETMRVYHLIRSLKKELKNQEQSAIWLTDILAALNIKESTYCSKYAEVDNDTLGKKNKVFRHNLCQALR